MSESVFVSIEPSSPVGIARIVSPSVGEREAGIIQSDILNYLDQTPGSLVLDMANVQIVTSIGLGMLITVSKRCRESSGKLAIFGLRDELLDLIKLTKLDRILTIKRDEAAALKAASR